MQPTKQYIASFLLLGILISGLGNALFAQAYSSLQGIVLSQKGEPLPGASVVLQELKLGQVTDENGRFIFNKIPHGDYHLQISYIGYKKQVLSITLNSANQELQTVKLTENQELINEVQVVDKSENTRRNEQAYNVTSLKVKDLATFNTDVNNALSLITGINIRQSGGLGSQTTFSLNGFQDNQVRFFLDGVPMTYFGDAFNPKNFPLNMIDRVEVYKGVVPVYLGSDALGGAVNIITKQNQKSFLNASYSVGSFNTHRGSIIGHYYNPKNGFVFNGSAYINYSDNDYKIDVEMADSTGKLGDPVEVRRFHDLYRSMGFKAEAGLHDKKWADDLMISFMSGNVYDQIQHGYVVRNAIGAAFNTSKSIMPALRYSKSDFLTKNLSLKLHALYNKSIEQRVDTASRNYDWYGNYTVSDSHEQGETSNFAKSLFSFNDKACLAIANLSYEINSHQNVSFNYSWSNFSRKGEDPLAIYTIPFEKPNIIDKNILGLSYKLQLLGDRLSIIAFAKKFLLHSHTIYAAYGDYEEFDKHFSKNGLGGAVAYHLNENWLVKTSVENTYRLPTGAEFFGNGLLIKPNPELQPEQSTNYNLGLQFNQLVGRHHLSGEVGGILRQARSFIRLKTNGITGSYENLEDVNIRGVDAQLRYGYNDWLSLGLNTTYQDMRCAEGNYKGMRIPNQPFLFGNGDISLSKEAVWQKNDRLSLVYRVHYVKAFYLFWEKYGSTKYDVPDQLLQSLGLRYSFDHNRYNLALECSNITDARLYDNYGLQKPGRAFYLTLNYNLQKH